MTTAYRIIACLVSLICFLLVFSLGAAVREASPDFAVHLGAIALIPGIAAALLLLLLLKLKRAFAIGLLLFTLATTFSVNPLYRGLSPILGSELAAQIRVVNAADDQNSVWVVFDRLDFGNYLAANGVRVLNGVYMYPNLAFWREFNPAGRIAAYNRYGYVLFTRSDSDQAEFRGRNDVVEVKINPCAPILDHLNVNYFLFTSEVKESCLMLVRDLPYPNLHFYIYKRVLPQSWSPPVAPERVGGVGEAGQTAVLRSRQGGSSGYPPN
jgi:hypothetical protein